MARHYKDSKYARAEKLVKSFKVTSKVEVPEEFTDDVLANVGILAPISLINTQICKFVVAGDATATHVSKRAFSSFVKRYGPLRDCLNNVKLNLYNEYVLIPRVLSDEKALVNSVAPSTALWDARSRWTLSKSRGSTVPTSFGTLPRPLTALSSCFWRTGL